MSHDEAKYYSQPTNPASIRGVVAKLRQTFNSNVTLPESWRRAQLLKLQALMAAGREKLARAMYEDLHRSRFESQLLELGIVDHEIQAALDGLSDWMKPESKPTNFLNFPASSYVKRDPYGVVLIMSPWNYPVQLLLAPLVGALAAGNTVLLRPGTFSCKTSEALRDLIEQFFAAGDVAIVVGDRDVTTAVLAERVDYIMFTGGPTLGRVVHAAANKYLTPVTLELGGKSPSYVDATADLDIAAKRLTWATFVNAGQTCVRPDYLMVQASVAPAFVAKVKACIKEFYSGGHADASEFHVQEAGAAVTGKTLASSKDSAYLGRIIDGNDAIGRLAGLLKADKQYVTEGGDVDAKARYVSPTLLEFGSDKTAFERSATMQHEIFGPLLPILVVKDESEAIALIRAREKPLALYVYSLRSDVQERFANETSSGSLVFNDAIVHLANHALPFGGVGNSGMGGYHGKYTFLTFSHAKSVMSRSNYMDMPARYPPYDATKRTIFGLFSQPIPKLTLQASVFVAVALSAYLARGSINTVAEKAFPYLVKLLPLIIALGVTQRFFGNH